MSLSDVIAEIREYQQPTQDRAYARLCRAVQEGAEISLSDHDLVLAISRALWERQLATVQLGLTELEIRTAGDAVAQYDERQAA